jgi:hypothetical protein
MLQCTTQNNNTIKLNMSWVLVDYACNPTYLEAEIRRIVA